MDSGLPPELSFYEEVQNKTPWFSDLDDWLTNLGKFTAANDIEYLERDTPDIIRYRIYTDNNRYTIMACRPFPGKKGYLGCIASNRKTRAGEDWHRGNDLADGFYHPDTWHEILADIVSYELVKVHTPKEDGPVTESAQA